ncbi:hypothetical protein CK203_041218 [Vitis vinifera]|uniref:BED-type domain-containing protein n=1 Tax=Vitis vinifera TaxID=29760 RepID=A0A438HT74_VITVI|nr:hypothetical protein CK203_041218 [Vitis vinifera]
MASNLTPSSGQDSTTHSQSSRSKTDPAWEHVSEERYGNGRRALICLYCKKITKGGGIHRMKLHLAGVKGDIGPCKSVPPDVRFAWKILCKRDMAEGEEEVQEMQSPMAANSGKRKKSTVDKYFAPRNTQGAQPSMRSVLAGKEPMLDVISAIGPGYKGPNYYQLRINLLKDAKKEVQLLVDSYRAIWAKVGCTIMGDGWTDNRQRTLINFLVYCPEGISFVKSVDAWTLSRMQLICFSYLMRMDRDSRPGATRFATTFIALKSLHDHKHDLQALVTSKFFVDSRYSKDYKSQVAVSIILDNRFWNDCLIVVNLMSPLMRLLRIVDCDERPSMGYVYEGMYRVRLGIKKLFNYSERLYKPYTEIIKQRWDQQLKKSIHSAAYWLNPCFQYDQENFCNKPNVIGGVMDVIDQKMNGGGYMIQCTTFTKVGHSNIEPNRIVFWMFYNKKRIYDPIDYACIDETDFWVVDDDQPAELDVEELENLLYEEGSIPINEVEGSSSHIDDEDGGDMAREGLDVENFGFPNAHFQSPYSNFPNE